MRPSPPVHNIADMLLANTIFVSDINLIHSVTVLNPDTNNIASVEPSLSVSFSFLSLESAFFSSIDAIGLRIANPKMTWIATWGIIASMTGEEFPWIDSSRKENGDPVGSVEFSFPPLRGICANMRNAIPAWASKPNPWPALVWSPPVDMTPKVLNLSCRKSRHRFTLLCSHLVSLKDWWSGPHRDSDTLCGSFYFTSAIGGCK